ncbi:MAG: hypothetical protein ACLGH8_05680 [Bacteroidia bacterium]
METNHINAKAKIVLILKWIFSILFILGALGAILNKSILSATFFFLFAMLLFPPVSETLNRIPALKNNGIKTGLLILFFALAAVFNNPQPGNKKPISREETITSKIDTLKKINESKQKKFSVISYKIIQEANIRFDGAPSYFVLIEEINLSDEKFKSQIKTLINQIIAEKGAKINIEILDNKKALQLMFKSSYGTNTLGRILNKNEMAQLEKHSIASFSGELSTDYQSYFNTLYFFPSASKVTPIVGKHVEIEEYNPIILNNQIVNQQRRELEREQVSSENKKKDFEENCLSGWDNSHKELVKYVKERMLNPRSFEHVETRYGVTGDYVGVVMIYRETNAFGAIVTNSIKAKVSLEDCSIISAEE